MSRFAAAGRRIAPRLLSGDTRHQFTTRIDPKMMIRIMRAAYSEGKSVSWFLEELLAHRALFGSPVYKNPPAGAYSGRSSGRSRRSA